MSEQTIDVARLRFWLFFLVALAILVPIVHARLRRWAWAGLNLFFLGQFISPYQLGGVVIGLLVTWVCIRHSAGQRGRILATLTLGGSCLGLFLLNKLPAFSIGLHAPGINSLLSTVGFSYVALRVVEVLRAVYEGRYPAPDLASVTCFLLPFHMLAAGPIQAYDDFAKQLPVPPERSAWDVLRGWERIALGLTKKFILAYALQKLFLTGFRAGGLYFIFEVQVFFLWLYLDFSAWSDLAVGMGKLLGVATPENFQHPYLARNMIDFWERWHISLSQFIRRNIFIPLQLWLMRGTGGRFPRACSSLVYLVAFGLCGLWHGISLPFLAWGLMHALGLIITSLYGHYLTRRLGGKGLKTYRADKRIRVFTTLLTFEFVAFSLVIIVYPWQELWQ
jgi:D-alanyl-lipoteichoic acid acyltransferase DltB (MBOAT superfamily)